MEGPATFDLPSTVSFVEAAPETAGAARLRRWNYAPDGRIAECIVGLNVQGRFTGDFPAAQRALFEMRVQAAGDQVVRNDIEAGPPGTKSGLLQQERILHGGRDKTTRAMTWTRTYVTPGGSFVELAASATDKHEAACRPEAVVRSLGWTGQEVRG